MTNPSGGMQGQMSAEQAPVLLTIWGAFLMSHVMMGAVALYLRQTQSVGSDVPVEAVYLLLGIGVVAPCSASLLGPILLAAARRGFKQKEILEDERTLFSAFTVQSIVRFALGDIGAVAGLVVMLLSGSLVYWAISAGVGFASIFLALPTRDRFDAFRRDVR
jgi:hypothetical protein